MTPDDVKNNLAAYAEEIGLCGLAVAPAQPLTRAAERLKDRVSKGYAGHYGLTEGSEERFCHPERILPSAKSIICFALSYFRDNDAPAHKPGELIGIAARFARGRDYHQVLAEKLALLSARLKELIPEAETRAIHDTRPLLDRAAAEASGLGWYGKNACFFVPRFGSWVVLGEIVTNIGLPHDPPILDHRCGSCTICLSACPTGAIKTPFEIDLNLCISHLTQMSGIIPRELRPLMSNKIYGCDICQEVCPQNKQAEPGRAEDFEPSAMPAALDLVALLEMDKVEFTRTLSPSAAGWIGRNRLKRNACIALGNLRDSSTFTVLRRVMQSDPSDIVRAHAAWALREIGTSGAVSALETAAKRERNALVIAEIGQCFVRKSTE